ncbi:sigma factor, partial [Clostridioides difficile]|nr:sigma factor [Clostridioides difficile]
MSPADEAWVKELYEANALKLYKVAFRRLGDKDEAENVVQEAFLLLLARFDTVRVHPNPSGWLMKVVQNLIRHSMDRNQKQSSHEISIEEQITQISAPPKQFFSLRDILPPGLTQRE